MGAIPNPFLTIFGIGRGRSVDHGLFAVGNARLPDDPIGSATVTFAGVNAGSEIRVYLSDMTEVAGVESGAADQSLSWDVYAPGSPNNTVRIVIIHPSYKIKEFTYTATAGSQNIPVQQEPDKWYSNP
ncbi:MAG: hypothetical protein ACK4FP_05015 [Azonexus sp.]